MVSTAHRMAAGYLLHRVAPDGGLEWLVLWNAERDEAGFPKGHAEAGETAEQAARRETEEETGLDDLDVAPGFEATLLYDVVRRGVPYRKTVHYYAARTTGARLRLSKEHARHAWLPLPAALDAVPHETLRGVLRRAALHARDPRLATLDRHVRVGLLAARRHLLGRSSPHEKVVGHLTAAARHALAIARGLGPGRLEVPLRVVAAGTLLHDVGRAMGHKQDHPIVGLEHLASTPFAPAAPAAWTHFTKGATEEELVAAGVPADEVARARAVVDPRGLSTWEAVVALADACTNGDRLVVPEERFADLRTRYDAPRLIDLQERRTAGLRARLAALGGGRDPLAPLFA